MTTTKLLTAAEAAERLRCNPLRIKRLRLAGLLAYIPGRPVLIPETAIEAYIATACAHAAAKVAANAKGREAKERRARGEETEEEVRARARRQFAEEARRKQIAATVKQAEAARLAAKAASKANKS